MVRREAFLNKLRELGYSYKSQQAHSQLFKRKGGQHRVFVRMTDLLEDDYVIGCLRQADVPEADIRAFLAAVKG